jgi:hypothetical protein
VGTHSENLYSCIKQIGKRSPDRLCVCPAQVTPLVIDESLLAMCQIVADVKGWRMQQAAEKLLQNFRTFYEGQF